MEHGWGKKLSDKEIAETAAAKEKEERRKGEITTVCKGVEIAEGGGETREALHTALPSSRDQVGKAVGG